jgi:hypothetical protein
MRRLVLFVVACGAPRAPVPVANQAAVPPRPVCADRMTEIEATLRDRWQITGELHVRCTAGTFPGPGYFIQAFAASIDRTGVLDADGRTIRVPFVDEKRPLVATSVIDYATVDLDGDGVDEIVETWRKRAHDMMGTDSWLVIRRIEDQAFTRVLGPHLSVYHPELGGCRAEVKLAGRTLVITVEDLPGIPPSDCLSRGTHTFALRDGAVVEIDPP